MRDKSIALIFGSFNPPTIAHVKMYDAVKEFDADLDICYVLSNEKYYMGYKHSKSYTSMDIRMHLLSGAVAKPSLYSTVEKDINPEGKTYLTVEHFKKHYTDVYICLGEDNLNDLHNWFNAENLVKENKFLIFTRGDGGHELPDFCKAYESNFTFIDFPYADISSTTIRGAYLNGQLDYVRTDIPDNVYKYLKSHDGLFKEGTIYV